MAKYIHKNLIQFIKSDSKKIKNKHKSLKTTYILNILSTFFGWRHFNELKLNLDKSEYPQDNLLIKINKMKNKDLNIFKDEYVKFINDKFNNGAERHNHDPLLIKKGPFYRLKTIENDFFINKVKSLTLIAKKENFLPGKSQERPVLQVRDELCLLV